ncbi:DUF1289 domain-containing protein [Chitinilyticum piscinae]|uniref:DUF1289 domain-containing protein n=1 Tax=Chitinilyticum piscinae TaxID=2866724 RepID=A0A8J7FNS8_9NEIS|nr:DUF1289 domain-containing protein [Chitinilyticum piscinae]MBE9610216.1 DUF1289 domain-containing protein [Chitinilyticum piscinae]
MKHSSRPDTPCIAVCSTALGDEVCRGCGRSSQEVAMWVTLDEAAREPIWQRLEAFWAKQGCEPPWLRR